MWSFNVFHFICTKYLTCVVAIYVQKKTTFDQNINIASVMINLNFFCFKMCHNVSLAKGRVGDGFLHPNY